MNEVIALLEHDISGVRPSWVFPQLERGRTIDILASRAQLLGSPLSKPTFVWSRWNSTWWYSLARERAEGADVVHSTVSRFAIVVGSPVFDPERYSAMLTVLMRAFDSEQGSPLALLQRVLSIATKGSAAAPGGADFVRSRFDNSMVRRSCPFSAMLRQVGSKGAATLWTAMLLRARIAVFAPEVRTCLRLPT